jgi:antitoxin component YwqK of YwqJK toxin-antitoxin module
MCSRILAAVLCLPLALSSIAQPGPAADNRTDAQGRKQGAWVKHWPNGKPRYVGTFKDDKPVGEFRHFDEDGRLATVQVHAGDGHVSRARHFHPNGTLMATGKYVDQQKDSTWTYYDGAGELRKVENYRKGKLHGEQIAYYPGGAKAEEEHYENGVLHGETKGWFANGNLRMLTTYVHGQPDGPMEFHFPNGRKEIAGRMVNGDRDGAWSYYNEDGSLQLQVLYSRGQVVKEKKQNGTFTEYFDDERVKSQVTYKNGMREGGFVEYHDNGKWEIRPVPADPVMGTPADMERVLVGQTKKREGTYKADKLEGEVKEYDERGRVVKVTMYKDGEPVGRQ